MNAAAKSRSDEVLAQELKEAGINPDADTSTVTGGQKTNVTLQEALAESGQTLEELTAPTTSKGRKTRAAKATNDGEAPGTPTPRPRIIPGSTPSQVLAQHINDGEKLNAICVLEVGDQPSDANTTQVAGIMDNLAKKIGEKAVNLLRSRDNLANLQVYTRIGIEKLMKDGTMTSKALTDHYHSGAGGKNYSIGTARAQCNQLMTLLPAMKIATETSKGNLEVNQNSAILATLNLVK